MAKINKTVFRMVKGRLKAVTVKVDELARGRGIKFIRIRGRIVPIRPKKGIT